MNTWIPVGIPPYLLTKEVQGKLKTLARFRFGNEERKNEFWRNPAERKCRTSRKQGKTIEHFPKHCEKIRQIRQKTEEEERSRTSRLADRG